MKIIELESDIRLYQFEPAPGKFLGCNILALLNDGKVMLVDTGYEEQMHEVSRHLRAEGLSIDGIIISHFHSDHIYGLKMLGGIPTWGSALAKYSLDLWEEPQDHGVFLPAHLVSTPENITFGRHELTLVPFPGHSVCGILTVINKKYLHIGDELLLTNDGAPTLPCIQAEDLEQEWNALNKLTNYADFIFIPSHGAVIREKYRILCEINSRLAYLNAIRQSGGKISFEEATKECGCEFLGRSWHRFDSVN